LRKIVLIRRRGVPLGGANAAGQFVHTILKDIPNCTKEDHRSCMKNLKENEPDDEADDEVAHEEHLYL